MKKMLKKYLLVLMSMLLIFPFFGSCSGSAPELKVGARTEVISFFNERKLTNYFENKANIKIKWMDYGEENLYQRLQEDVGKSTKDLPDAYLGMGLYDNEVVALAGDLFLDLTNMVQDDTTEFAKILSQDNSRRAEMLVEGKIYSFPSFYEDYASQFPQKVWINTQWLQRVQAEMPETPDELLEVLRLFKTNDPNKNGEADEIPLGAAYQDGAYNTLGFLINAFLPTAFDMTDSQSYLNLDNQGQVYASITDSRFQEALMYIKGLMDEGLIHKELLTTGADTLSQGSAETELYGVIPAQDIQNLFTDSARLENYEPLPPLKGSGDVSLTYASLTKVQTGGYMLARDTEKKEEALRFGDAMLAQDGTLSILFGTENTGWGKADGRVTAMGGTETTWKLLEEAEEGTAPFRNLKGSIPLWYSAAVQMSQQATTNQDGKVELKSAENWAGYLNKVTYELYEVPGRSFTRHALPELVLTSEQEQALEADTRQQIYTYVQAACQDFVTGEKDIEKDWEAYTSQLNQLGLQTLVELTQQAYDTWKSLNI